MFINGSGNRNRRPEGCAAAAKGWGPKHTGMCKQQQADANSATRMSAGRSLPGDWNRRVAGVAVSVAVVLIQ